MDASDDTFLALLCWPLIAAGVALLFLLVQKRDQLEAAQRNVVSVIAGALILVPGVFVVFFSDLTAATLINGYIGWILIGFSLLALVARMSPIEPAWQRRGFLLGGVLLVFVGTWDVVGDYLLPRQYVAGEVTGRARVPHFRAPDTYAVFIEGRSFSTTAEVYGHVHRGLRIRGEIGAGTHTLLHAHLL